MTREKALEMLYSYVKTPHILRHSLAVEAVMKALAIRLNEQPISDWMLAGLLHDLDNDEVDWASDMGLHGPKTVEIMKSHEIGNESVYNAILAHNPENKSQIISVLDRALYAADPITGFINAITLVYPDKKISSVKVSSITKRMKEMRFAAGANRDAMRSIELLGLSFAEFAELALNAMREISDDLEL